MQKLLQDSPSVSLDKARVGLVDGYTTELGVLRGDSIESALKSTFIEQYRGKVQLIFTSPPFPLNRKKKYGNFVGEEYSEWLAGLAPQLIELLTPDGSIVIEMGNSWEPGKPLMSTLALRSLLDFLDSGHLNLCQQFVYYNPAKLPSPAQWVTIERIRVKDAYTHLWWMSPSEKPKADNKKILIEYSKAMKKLLKNQGYNSGKRPSEHNISVESFLADNGGAIPSNVLQYANTANVGSYYSHCKDYELDLHPARMPPQLVDFFIEFLTDPGDIVLDPFAGSNTTGHSAERLKRKWIGIEKNPLYIAGSIGRFEKIAEISYSEDTNAE